jgi:hypothetical protein
MIEVDRNYTYFQVRESIPDMACYVNDWATEMIVRQWMKNKRSYAVQKGFLEVKPKWEYLKENAAKRSNAPRGNGKRKATSQCLSHPAAKRARLAKRPGTTPAKGKGKARATVVNDDDDDDDDSDSDKSGGNGNEEEDDASDRDR